MSRLPFAGSGQEAATHKATEYVAARLRGLGARRRRPTKLAKAHGKATEYVGAALC